VTEPHPARSLVNDYAYGDSPVAIERLLFLAEIFAPSTKAFLERLPVHGPRVVLDLGCGPGESTRLLVERFPRAQTTGIDSSVALVVAARSRRPPPTTSLVADVSSAPLPKVPAILMYARLLSAHLRRPTDVVTSWAHQLRPGGALAQEEVEQIRTEDRLFHQYLELAASVLRLRGTDLFVAPMLARMTLPSEFEVTSSVCTVSASSRHAARMFALNLKTIRRDVHVTAAYTKRQVDAIAEGLDTRAGSGAGAPVAWEIRQAIVSRRASAPSGRDAHPAVVADSRAVL
jgi:trans-aconitate 2-methyltransferase